MKKTKKRKKSSRMHGRKMGTHGSGARKNKRHSGMKGGKGMSGSGKRADHKKTKVTKIYGHGYFGKKGFTSIGTKKDKRQRINLQQIEGNLQKYGKEKGDAYEVNLPDHKILGKGDVNHKLIIKAKKASDSAIKKVKEKGGEIQVSEKKSKGQENKKPKNQESQAKDNKSKETETKKESAEAEEK
ncbi:hypothetical protein GF378_02610 [Candidatus Pacearchaeota archaeon]|nr:hypothetical protein [Candidatus Pacearchaeota archaeon]